MGISWIITGAFSLLLAGAACPVLRADDENPVTPILPDTADHIGAALLVPRNQMEIGEVALIQGQIKLGRRIGAENTEASRLQVGDKLYVGDRFELAADGVIELVFGINARLRAQGPSSFLLRGMNSRVDGNQQESTLRIVELAAGSIRVRVKRNVVTPTRILLVANHLGLDLLQSDAVLQRSGTASSAFCLAGSAGLLLRETIRDDWSAATVQTLPEHGKALANDETISAGQYLVRPCDPQETESVRRMILFEIDKAWDALPVVPERNPEFEAP